MRTPGTSAVDAYLRELETALRVGGRARRRLVAECRDHLGESAAEHGADEAVRRFGDAVALARSYDTEIAVRRGLRATLASALGVLAVGASTLVVLNATDPGASAVAAWAVVFFAAAQTSGVSLVLAIGRALAMRRRAASASEVALVCRRAMTALASSAVTLFAAGAAVPGHAPAWAVLGGPAAAMLALPAVLRTRSLARRVVARPARGVASPIRLLAATVAVGTVAAFAWDQLDRGTLRTSFGAAATEAGLTLVGFAVLGPALGLWSARRPHPGWTAPRT